MVTIICGECGTKYTVELGLTKWNQKYLDTDKTVGLSIVGDYDGRALFMCGGCEKNTGE